MSGRALIGGAAATAASLVASYVALGGGGYEPPPTADPCAPRAFAKPRPGDELAERLALSALDGAACELGIAREELVLALASSEARERFRLEHELAADELEDALRAGILRAVDDASRVDAIDPAAASFLRLAAQMLPLESIVDALRRERLSP